MFSHIDGILQKGPYLPCVSMTDRVLLAGYHWYDDVMRWKCFLYCWPLLAEPITKKHPTSCWFQTPWRSGEANVINKFAQNRAFVLHTILITAASCIMKTGNRCRGDVCKHNYCGSTHIAMTFVQAKISLGNLEAVYSFSTAVVSSKACVGTEIKACTV